MFIIPSRGRPNTIRSIVSSLVGEGGDLVDENEPIQPLEPQYEDYTDPNWEPEAIDASPGNYIVFATYGN